MTRKKIKKTKLKKDILKDNFETREDGKKHKKRLFSDKDNFETNKSIKKKTDIIYKWICRFRG